MKAVAMFLALGLCAALAACRAEPALQERPSGGAMERSPYSVNDPIQGTTPRAAELERRSGPLFR